MIHLLKFSIILKSIESLTKQQTDRINFLEKDNKDKIILVSLQNQGFGFGFVNFFL